MHDYDVSFKPCQLVGGGQNMVSWVIYQYPIFLPTCKFDYTCTIKDILASRDKSTQANKDKSA